MDRNGLRASRTAVFRGRCGGAAFRAGSARVGINQSPLSKAITLMEERLGVRLFIRNRRSSRLTECGEVLLKYARKILADVGELRARVVSIAGGHVGWLRIAFGEGVAYPYMARLLVQTRDAEPEVIVTMRQLPVSEQLRELTEERIDLGFIRCVSSPPPTLDSRLVAIPVWRDPMVLVVPAEHPIATQPAVQSLSSFAGTYLFSEELYYTDGDAIRKLLTPVEHEVGCCSSIEEMFMVVSARYGLGVIGATQARMLKPEGLVFRPIGSRHAGVTTYILQQNGGDASTRNEDALAARFIERARNMGRENQAAPDG